MMMKLEYDAYMYDLLEIFEEKSKTCTHDYLGWLVRNPKGDGSVMEYACMHCGKPIDLTVFRRQKT